MLIRARRGQALGAMDKMRDAESMGTDDCLADHSGKLDRWPAVIAATLALIAVGGGVSTTYGIFSVYWVAGLGLSRGTVILAGSLAPQIGGVLGVFIGRWLGRGAAERSVLLVGIAAGAGTLALLSVATSLWMILFAYAVPGSVAIACTGPLLGQLLATRLFANPGLPISIVSIGIKVGAAVSPLLAGLLALHFNLSTTQLIMAAIITLFAPIIFFCVPASGNRREAARTPAGPPDSIAVASLPAGGILDDPVFRGMIAMTIMTVGVSAAIYFNLPFLVVEQGAKPAVAAYIIFGALVAGIIVTPIVGFWTDRIDPVRLLPIPVALVSLALGLLVMPTSLPRLALAMLLVTLANAVVLPCLPTILRRRFGVAGFPIALGLAQPFFYISSLGAFVAAALRDAVGGYRIAFAWLWVAVPVLILGWLLVRRGTANPVVGNGVQAG